MGYNYSQRSTLAFTTSSAVEVTTKADDTVTNVKTHQTNKTQLKTTRKQRSISAAIKTKPASIHHLEHSKLQTLTNTSRNTAQ
jgi:hypothetical protein